MVLIPLLTIALSVCVALKGLSMLTIIPGFKLANVSQIFAVVMLYGAGTDYCLFLISRYREELAEGRPIGSAVERSMGNVGHALAASAGTVIFGLGLMGTAEFVKIRSGGRIRKYFSVRSAQSITHVVRMCSSTCPMVSTELAIWIHVEREFHVRVHGAIWSGI
jgi:hypothetical protein